jgi:hypothetical protein
MQADDAVATPPVFVNGVQLSGDKHVDEIAVTVSSIEVGV